MIFVRVRMPVCMIITIVHRLYQVDHALCQQPRCLATAIRVRGVGAMFY